MVLLSLDTRLNVLETRNDSGIFEIEMGEVLGMMMVVAWVQIGQNVRRNNLLHTEISDHNHLLSIGKQRFQSVFRKCSQAQIIQPSSIYCSLLLVMLV